MKNQLKALSGVLALALAGQVSAATTWTLNTTVVAGDNSAVTSTATGYANTVGTANSQIEVQNSLNLYWDTAPNPDVRLGLGITHNDTETTSSPQHAVDNNGRYEMVLLTFSSAVKLEQMRMGWAGTDSDVTVMAYTGSGTTTINQKTWSLASLTGWSVIANYANVGTSATNINSGGTSSSYWLIGAYNPLGGSVATGFTNNDDYVKLLSVTGCVSGTTGCNPPPGKVPEPSSLALIGIGLIGLIRLRKERARKG